MSHWWCPSCKEELRGNQVTYYEKCEDCGTSVIWIDDKYANIDIEEVLEKQIPMKFKNTKHAEVECPRCGKAFYIHFNDRDRYCEDCGQRLTNKEIEDVKI